MPFWSYIIVGALVVLIVIFFEALYRHIVGVEDAAFGVSEPETGYCAFARIL